MSVEPLPKLLSVRIPEKKIELTIRLDGVIARIALPRAMSRVRRFCEEFGLDRRGWEVDVTLDFLPGVRLGENGRADGGFGVSGGHFDQNCEILDYLIK